MSEAAGTIDAVDALALLARGAALPPPEVRVRLRKAGNLTQAEVAEAMGVTELSVLRWEKGQASPHPARRRLYAHLLEKLAEKYPEAAVLDTRTAS